ncbi:hypothetical protein ACFVIM_06850 [Streptomyces sp. NPDC057638]|uniref:hypothetical protein n=1 Tax=Streptomyces sp. NPDC057638 TaxID=3346190 RepID=UPI0036A58DA9
MDPIVVYVHGIGNKVRAESLKSIWDAALFGTDMGTTSRMAYWAPLRYETPLPDSRWDPLEGGTGGPGAASMADAGPGAPGAGGPPGTWREPSTREPSTREPSTRESPAEGPSAGGPPGARLEPPAEFIATVEAEAVCAAGARRGEPRPYGRVPTETRPPAGPALGGWLREMTYLAEALADAEAAGAEPVAGLTAGPGPPAAPEPTEELLPLPRFARTVVFRTLVKYTFQDVYAYFFGGAGPAIRDVVRRELNRAGGAPLAVVAHSLGSVIAYEVLAESGREADLLLTLGSPLAATEIRDHLAAPPAVPSGVRRWHNVCDLRDLVANGHTLRPHYQPEFRITESLVINDSVNHHGVREYLGNRQVRTAFREFFDGREPGRHG